MVLHGAQQAVFTFSSSPGLLERWVVAELWMLWSVLSIGYLALAAAIASAFGMIGFATESVYDECDMRRCLDALPTEPVSEDAYWPERRLAWSLDASLSASWRSLRRLNTSDGVPSGRCWRSLRPCRDAPFTRQGQWKALSARRISAALVPLSTAARRPGCRPVGYT